MGETIFFFCSWFLWRVFFARRRTPANPRAILVVKLDHIGDGILALPALDNLRLAYPDSRIDLLCARWNRAAFATTRSVNRVMEFNPRTFRRTGIWDRASRFWEVFMALRGQYDMVVTLRGVWMTLLLAQGVWLDRGAARLEMRLRRARLPEHETDITLSVLEFAGIPTPRRAPLYPISKEAEEQADDLLERLGVPVGMPLVAVHAGSPVPEKRWVGSRYATLINRLSERGAHVVLLGSADESAIVDEVRLTVTHPTTNLTGKTSFPQLAAVLKRCACFVGNDSAPMHLSAAVGTPTLGLFFSSDPRRFGPRGNYVHILRATHPRLLTAGEVLKELDSWRTPVSR